MNCAHYFDNICSFHKYAKCMGFMIVLFISFGAYGQNTIVSYTPSTLDFPNPERGFYHHTETHSNAYTPLSTTDLTNFRTSESVTLILRVFYLEDFVNAPISANYLSQLQTDLNAVRNAGIKCIVRFAYNNQPVGWPPASPYGDATKAWMLSHIAQLEPYLQNNSDIIALAQTGFIGLWGEWYYTTHFGDPLNGNPTAANYADRKEVTDRLLTALPVNRMVQLRTPYFKYRLYRANVLAPLGNVEAFNGTAVSRVGHHNDCFLASADDFGTYRNTATEYNYLSSDTRYVPMGGETCQLNAPRTNCNGDAVNELSLFHWSFINRDYINTVWDAWNTQGCMADVKKNLGYRIQLNSGTFTTATKAGGSINISLSLTNKGYTSMFNPRLLQFVLVNTSDGKVCKASTTTEPRAWTAGGTVTLNYELGIPANYPNGTYKVMLSLPDPETNLYEKATYSVRLANGNTTWDNVKGYNYLGFDLTINNALMVHDYAGSDWFSTCYGALPLEWLDLTAVQRDDVVAIQWTTAHEVQNDYFIIEKSSDGKVFTPLGKVDPSPGQAINHYKFDDYSLSKGMSYYRIAQYDVGGSVSYSKIISWHPIPIHQVLVSPNPFSAETQLFFAGYDQEETTVLIKDINGSIVAKDILQISNGFLLIGKNLTPGIYVVILSTAYQLSYIKIIKTGE